MSLAYHSPGGITIRQDQEALFGYLPKEGFAFFAPASDFDVLKQLLASKHTSDFPAGYERLIKNMHQPFEPNSARRLGSSAYQWETLPLPEAPLIINWMITGNCNHSCAYCYAQDIMRAETDPTEEEFINTIGAIKEYKPVAVVITGGEPTLSDYFERAIDELSQFTSVIVDTNGTLLSEHHMNILTDRDIHVRVSLDSNRHIQNLKTRIPKNKKESMLFFEKTWNNIYELTKRNIKVTINTVATTYNYDDIKGLEKDVSRLNVSKLRVRFVEKTKTISDYLKITGSDNRIKRFLRYTTEEVNGAPSVPIYISMNRQRNSVVIVSPKGNFFTESHFVEQGKVLIDPDNPTSPSLDSIRKRVDMHAHSARYLFT